MWDQLNSFTKQIAEQASQAVKDAGIEKQLVSWGWPRGIGHVSEQNCRALEADVLGGGGGGSVPWLRPQQMTDSSARWVSGGGLLVHKAAQFYKDVNGLPK